MGFFQNEVLEQLVDLLIEISRIPNLHKMYLWIYTKIYYKLKYIQMEPKLKTFLQKYKMNSPQMLGKINYLKHSKNKWEQFIDIFVDDSQKYYFQMELNSVLTLTNQQSSLHFLTSLKSITPNTININEISKELNMRKQLTGKHIDYAQWTKNHIDQNLKSSGNIGDFLKKQINLIFDILQRRSDILTYFNYVKQVFQPNNPIKETLENINFIDFIILVLYSVEQKETMYFLLQQQNIVLPFCLQINNKMSFSFGLKSALNHLRSFLVLNVGIGEAAGYNTARPLAKILQIPDDCAFKSHNKNVFSFMKKNSPEFCKKYVEFVAFSDDPFGSNLQMSNRIFSLSSLIIFHVTQKDIVNNIFERAEIINSFKNCQLIIILIWRSSQNSTLYQIETNFFSKIKQNKIIDYISSDPTNLKQTILNATQNINLMNRKFSLADLYPKQHLNSVQKIPSLSKVFLTEEYKRSEFLPNLVLSQRLNQAKQKIRDSTDIKEYFNFQSLETELQTKLKKPVLTQFVKDTLNLLGSNSMNEFIWKLCSIRQNKIGLYINNIELFRKRMQTALLQERSNIKAQAQNMKQIMKEYCLTIDNIILQYCIYYEANKQENFISKITEFYSKLLLPINILDGVSLKLGSVVLETFFKQLDQKYKNRKIFVVSAVGSPSSGKTTILNYLFRYNFFKQKNQLAKGLYFGICQLDGKVLVIFETQGILTQQYIDRFDNQQIARKTIFDNQIIGLVMKISDLIIITGIYKESKPLKMAQLVTEKIDIANQIKRVVLSSYQLLNALQSSQNEIKPKKLLIAISNRQKPIQLIEKNQLIGEIMTGLKELLVQDKGGVIRPITQQEIEEAKDKFNRYMSIDPENIFALPANSNRKNAYGQQILRIRSDILQMIQNSQEGNRGMQILYKEAQAIWQIIKLTGQNIMKYQTTKQAKERSQLEVLYQQIFLNKQMLFSQKFQQLQSKLINSIKQASLQSIEKQLTSLKNACNQQMFYEFKAKGEYITDISFWIKDYSDKIKRTCESFYYKYKQQVISKFEQSQRDKSLKKFTEQILQNLVLVFKKNTQNLQQYDQICQQKLNLEKNNKPIKSIIEEGLMKNFTVIFQSQSFFGSLKIQHVKDCIDLQKKVSIQNKYLFQFLTFSYPFSSFAQPEENIKQNFSNILRDQIQLFKRQIYSACEKKNTQEVEPFAIERILQNTNELRKKIVQNSIKLSFNSLSNQNQEIVLLNKSIQNKILQLGQLKNSNLLIIKQLQQCKYWINQILIQIEEKNKIRLLPIQKRGSAFDQSTDQATLIKQLERLNDQNKSRQAYLLDKRNHLMLSQKAIEKVLQQLGQMQQRKRKNQEAYDKKVQLLQVQYKIYLFGVLFKQLTEIIYHNQQNLFNKMIKSFQEEISKKRTYIQQMSNVNQGYIRVINEDFEFYLARKQEQSIYKSERYWKNQLMKFIRSYNPATMMEKAFKNTFFSQQFSKVHLKDCYKFLKNKNRYIFELLYQQVNKQLLTNLKITNYMHYAAEDLTVIITAYIKRLENVQNVQRLQQELRKQGLLAICQLIQSNFYVKMLLNFGIGNFLPLILKIFRENLPQITQNLLKYFQQNIENYKKNAFDFVRQQLREQVIGCPEQCPLCGAKCIRHKNHLDSHIPSSKIHTFLAFGGCTIKENQQFILNFCRYQQIIRKDMFYFINTPYSLQDLEQRYALWKNNIFTSNLSLSELEDQATKNFKAIWANIQLALIKSKYYNGKESSDIFVQKIKGQNKYLTQADLEELEKDPWTQQIQRLKNY